ncbi:MAG TPA: hypothetical protein VFN42_13325, partial [Acetobacteraceae bacterium]|nr:hypothetical protein [Acetobacteraceae bacterium]
FGASDTIDLYLINATSLSFANGVLTVMNGTTAVESLPMSGSYTTANFQMMLQPGSEFSNAITYVPDASGSGSGSGSTSPQVNAPASETVVAGGTLAIPGVSVTDSFAAANPGSMALNVTDTSGTLRMTDAGGAALAGSGTAAIHYSGSLAEVNAALATLSYAAGSAASDSITVDIWDQAGKEATGSIGVTVGGSAATPTPTPVPTPTPTPTGGSVISGTPGDDTIVSNLNNVTINAGAGNNTIFAGGTGDTITAADGNNTVQAFAGGNTISTGAGNDTIRIAGSANTVNAGGGINQISDSGSGNTLVLPGAGQGTDNVYGYVLAGNDTFDLRSALASAGWQGSQATLPDFLAVGTAHGGADTTISVTPGGGAGSVVATLYGNGAIPLASFLQHALVS